MSASLSRLRAWRVAPLGLTVIALIVWLVCGHHERFAFFQAYLLGYLYWFGLGIGSYAFLMIYDVAGGRWGRALRPLFSAGASTLALLALLMVPLFWGQYTLYAWADPTQVAVDPVLIHKQRYLNPPLFVVRAVVYFAIWLSFVFAAKRRPSRRLAAWALISLVLTLTFASFDWSLSLEPHWSSTIYGLLVLVIDSLSAIAFITVVAALLRWSDETQANHDLGNFVLMSVLLFAYLSFSQFLIIWSGNVGDETPWYLKRISGPFASAALFVIVANFVLPFLLLLNRNNKRSLSRLAVICALILGASLVHLFWFVVPSFARTEFFHIDDLLIFAALGGLWLSYYFWRLEQLAPLSGPSLNNNPSLREAHV